MGQNELAGFEEYLRHMGYADSTIKRLMTCARRVIMDGADESDIKEIYSKHERHFMRQAINRLKDYEASKNESSVQVGVYNTKRTIKA